MSLLPLLLFAFVRFWFIEAPLGLGKYFASLNTSFLQLFSLPMLLRTFFQPLKNEYRQGLVGFSQGMGIAIKSFLILFDVFGLVGLLCLEVCLLVLFVLFPLLSIIVLFY